MESILRQTDAMAKRKYVLTLDITIFFIIARLKKNQANPEFFFGVVRGGVRKCEIPLDQNNLHKGLFTNPQTQNNED